MENHETVYRVCIQTAIKILVLEVIFRLDKVDIQKADNLSLTICCSTRRKTCEILHLNYHSCAIVILYIKFLLSEIFTHS